MGHEVSVNPVDDACLAGFLGHNDRHGSEEKERQPVPASRGYKHCSNEHRADSDLQAVVHTKLIPFLRLASARFVRQPFLNPKHLLITISQDELPASGGKSFRGNIYMSL